MKSNKTLLVLLLVAAAGLAAWYFFFRSPAQKVATMNTGFGPADDKAYKAMEAIFKKYAKAEDLHWMMPYVLDALAGKTSQVDYYLIDGKLSKAGAFLAIYAQAYYDNGPTYGIDRQALNVKLNDIFLDFKAQYLQSKISQFPT